MLRIACRGLSRHGTFNSHTVGSHRRYSLISIHSTFPASLLRLQSQPESKLLKRREDFNRNDSVIVSDDGLVYPWLSLEGPLSTGATFMPNTFLMQEFARMSLDDHLESIENGSSSDEPVIYSVAKGTPIPKTLSLLRIDISTFSLQPSKPVTLQALNNLLDDFYSSHAKVDTVGGWLESHDFEKALADDAEASWMNL